MSNTLLARLKRAYKSKTVWFGIAVGVLSVLQEFIFNLPVSPTMQALIGCVMAIIIVLLRFVTVVPLDAK